MFTSVFATRNDQDIVLFNAIERLTGKTKKGQEDLIKEQGLCCLAIPVSNKEGALVWFAARVMLSMMKSFKVVASQGVTAPSTQMTRERLLEIKEDMINAAREIAPLIV